MKKKNYLEPLKKCPRTVYFTLLVATDMFIQSSQKQYFKLFDVSQQNN